MKGNSFLNKMKLYLLRHFAHNGRLGAYYGSTNLPLKDLSMRPLELERALPVYSSPLLRCTQSLKHLGVNDFTSLETAKEVDFGDWEGKTFEEINSLEPTKVDEWAHGENFQFPGGEKVSDFENRMKALAITLRDVNEDLILVSHGGVIRTLLCAFLDIEFKKSFSFKVDLGSLTCLEIFPNGGSTLNFLNNTEMQTWPTLLS